LYFVLVLRSEGSVLLYSSLTNKRAMHLMTSSSTPERQHEMARLKRAEEGEEEETRSNNNGGTTKGGNNRKPPVLLHGLDNSNKTRAAYGAATAVETIGTFPQAGSILGPYFCLGTLGKGTFSSIHKCINLGYAHNNNNNSSHWKTKTKPKYRLAAAKVELSDFVNSGVLLGEALVLDFLDESLPRGTVPVYMGHYSCTKGNAAAIVMEYLPGEDMHQLRENRNSQSPTGKAPRRLTIEDAVFLTADVMLPLLEQMHKVGIVHRDVKPSNCVRKSGRQFCMVDFGLSKSVVVPMDSGFADKQHAWPTGQPWLVSSESSTTTTSAANTTTTDKNNTNGNDNSTTNLTPTMIQGCYRKERTKAEFRGTSMYASPRVHQERDYSPRDDVWSLMYVFCDLVSGGLPWMSHAANRDRDMCQKIKERVHGLVVVVDGSGTTEPAASNKDETERLLMGDEYHVALFRHLQKEGMEKDPAAPANSTTTTSFPDNFPKPLEMAQDKTKIKLLRQAFAHLAKLQFWDQPDYALIRRCIHGFLDEEGAVGEADDIEIDWNGHGVGSAGEDTATLAIKKKRKRESKADRDVPKWNFSIEEHGDSAEIEEDPMICSELFEGIQPPPEPAEPSPNTLVTEYEKFIRRLPLEEQFRVAQMEYHASHPTTAIKHIVLRDWMKVAIPLLYKDWDAKAYETGGHRTSSDGYRREFYLELTEKCTEWAKVFNNFSKKEYFGYDDTASINRVDVEEGEAPPLKNRRIESTFPGAKASNDLVAVSKVLFALKAAARAEREKSFAPPPLLSFGASR
jgi:serine/threonine protein kinase